jgi:hypothetical protein
MGPGAKRWMMRQGKFHCERKSYVVFPTFFALLLGASISLATTGQEQSTFKADPSERLARPMPVPDAILQILSKDETVMACVRDSSIPHRSSLRSWFGASAIHLNGPDETDLVVLPVAKGSRVMCFQSVEGIGWFWVFRPIGGGYELVLKAAGLGLSVLDSRHNGYRDIRSGGQVGKWSTEATFRFDGKTYREY